MFDYFIRGGEINMKKSIFTGSATAIVTPMTKDGIDYETFARLIDWQISEGTDAIVVSATTGESATIREDEHSKLVSFTVDKVAGRVPVIAGAGTNDTSHSIRMAKNAKSAGVDALLIVTPYYNKCTQAGFVKVIETISKAAPLPIIIYNVPSRTGLNLLPSTYLELSKNEYVYGVKEANSDIVAIADTFMLAGDKLDIYSGNDDQIVPILSLGGKGVISVLANIAPKVVHEICERFFEGDIEASRRLQLEYLPLIHALFSEVNPIPVKAALSAMGFGENYLRLPLTKMTSPKYENMIALMKEKGII